MYELTPAQNRIYKSNTRGENAEVIQAPVGQLVSVFGEITLNAPFGSIVRAERGSIVHAQAGAVIQACFGATIIVEGKCVIFQFGGAKIEYKTDALVLSPSAVSRTPHQFLTVKQDRTFGDNMVLIVMPGVYVRCGNNCHILAFDDTIVETGDCSRVLSDNDCVVKTGENGFIRAGNNSSIYAGKKSRINCGDFCTVKTSGDCRITAGKELNRRLVNG
ncbi:MAG: hypothetical protein SGJ27_24635 [Candidatus Melainabacteria bacterium]|nr:hypothetical protein [Candidatus Melainabacteria bacterium]